MAYLNRGVVRLLLRQGLEANSDFDECLRLSGDLRPALETRIKEIKRSLILQSIATFSFI